MTGVSQSPPHSDSPHIGDSSSLELARVRGVYLFEVLIAVLVLTTAAGVTPHIDVAFFGTLVGGLIALLGLGSVVRLVVAGRAGVTGDDQK